jgi:hypothetical protein
VSNTDNVNILCTYWLTIDWYWQTTEKRQTRPLVREGKSSVTALARARTNSKLQTRPPVREGATKLQTRNCLKEISRRKKIDRGSQMRVWHQDGLADWLSVIMWLWLDLMERILSALRDSSVQVTGKVTVPFGKHSDSSRHKIQIEARPSTVVFMYLTATQLCCPSCHHALSSFTFNIYPFTWIFLFSPFPQPFLAQTCPHSRLTTEPGEYATSMQSPSRTER